MFMLIRPNKKFKFSCGHCSCTTFILTSYSLYTQVMLILILINVQYLQDVVFDFEKGLNGQNHSWPDSHHPIKKSPTKIPHSLPFGEIRPLSLNTTWITLSSSFATPKIRHNKGCFCSLSHPLILNILCDRSSY